MAFGVSHGLHLYLVVKDASLLCLCTCKSEETWVAGLQLSSHAQCLNLGSIHCTSTSPGRLHLLMIDGICTTVLYLQNGTSAQCSLTIHLLSNSTVPMSLPS
jgi:hypothetical protein